MGFIVAIIIGAIAGWLAGQIVKGHGQGTVMNIVVGVVGALIAAFLFPAMGWNIGAGPAVGNTVAGPSFLGSVIFATIGAVILLVILQLFNRR